MTATYRVWAPHARTVDVHTCGDVHALVEGRSGWWEISVPAGNPGDDYAFAVDGGPARPDPRSPWQPNGVDGASRSVDHGAFGWTDAAWRGRPLAGGVIYELHVGTFSPDGTFDGVVERLDHLVDLGVDFVEIMPVNAFPGRHGWGYDGVGLFAVHDAYGGPEGLKRLVDACHARGLGVLLDVVYNHLGPAGNRLPEFGPYLTDAHTTPWGPAINLDQDGCAEVREFLIDNARQWLRDYHVDGLRLDAVHALVDASKTHFLAELHDAVAALGAALGRTLVLIAESDANDPTVVTAREAGGHGMDAQWSDDFHHALHVTLTGEQDGYYADFAGLRDLAVALRGGYVYTGQRSAYRADRHGAMLPATIRGERLLGYAQTHDQVGNRARGERSAALLSPGLLQIAAALTLTSPFTPMLFMGEEWAASTPWMYFTDHEDPGLAEAVRNGRRAEFAAFGWDPADVPDPQDPVTFHTSRLDWVEPAKEPHASVLAFHRALIRLRHETPELTDGDREAVTVAYDESARWLVVRRGRISVAANLGPDPSSIPLATPPISVLLASEPGFVFTSDAITIAGESVAIVTTI